MRFTPLGLTIRAVMSNEPLARATASTRSGPASSRSSPAARWPASPGPSSGRSPGVDPTFGIGYFAPAFLAALLAGRRPARLVVACAVLGGSQVLFTRYENPIWSKAFVIGVAVVILRFLPNGFTWRGLDEPGGRDTASGPAAPARSRAGAARAVAVSRSLPMPHLLGSYYL